AELAFIVVVGPDPVGVEEGLGLVERLQASGMSIGALIVNRVRLRAEAPDGLAERLARVDTMRGLPPGEVRAGADALSQTCREQSVLARADALQIERLSRAFPQVIPVPLLATDVHDLEALGLVVAQLYRHGDMLNGEAVG
ncbi:MAG: hypothetical protein ACRDH5_08795, partial [bacterium]